MIPSNPNLQGTESGPRTINSVAGSTQVNYEIATFRQAVDPTGRHLVGTRSRRVTLSPLNRSEYLVVCDGSSLYLLLYDGTRLNLDPVDIGAGLFDGVGP